MNPFGWVRERSRGGDEHGGEWERVEGSAWRRQRRPGRRGGKQAGWRWRAWACVRRAHALVLLAKEEDDKEEAGGLGWPDGLPGERQVISLSLSGFLFSIFLQLF